MPRCRGFGPGQEAEESEGWFEDGLRARGLHHIQQALEMAHEVGLDLAKTDSRP